MIQEGGGRDKHISGYSGHQVKEPGDARVRDIRLRAGIQRVRGFEPARRGGHERRLMRPVGGEPGPKDHGAGIPVPGGQRTRLPAGAGGKRMPGFVLLLVVVTGALSK